jgi:5-(carboxyamino)imidazole ribonucleotide mutase
MMKMAKKVAFIMGSDSDFPVVEPAVKELQAHGVEVEAHVFSAHRTPQAAAEFAAGARENDFGVIICAAGMAAHLAGAIAAQTTLPVIGIPINASLQGLDALLSTVMMPPGVPVATVGINGAKNAAILALQILAVSDAELASELDMMKAEMADGVMKKDAALQSKI